MSKYGTESTEQEQSTDEININDNHTSEVIDLLCNETLVSEKKPIMIDPTPIHMMQPCTAPVREHSLAGNHLSGASINEATSTSTMSSFPDFLGKPEYDSMVRSNSLAGNPLPLTQTDMKAPPKSTLCPHAIKHKFPNGRYYLIKTDILKKRKPSDFLKSTLRHSSLDFNCFNNKKRKESFDSASS